MRLNYVERWMVYSFGKLGLKIGNNPWIFIITTLFICFLLSTGLYHQNFYIKSYDLLVPTNARSLKERAIIEHFFPKNISHDFDFGRTTSLDRWSRVIITAKDGGTMLKSSLFKEVIHLDELILNITVDYEGKSLTYSDICAHHNGKCFSNNIAFIKAHLKDFEEGIFYFKYPLMIDDKTSSIYFLPITLGGVSLGEQNYVNTSQAISFIYVLDFGDLKFDFRNEQWENLFIELLSQQTFEQIHVSYFTSESIIKEGEKSILNIIPYLIGAGIVIIVFSMITNNMEDCVQSKPWFSVFGIITSLIGTIAAFGLCQYIGVTCFSFNIVIIVIMMGISMDDTFVLLAAWRRTDRSDDVPTRLMESYKHAGIAITITSFTNAMTFSIGIFTPYAFTYIFSFYSMMSVIFCYFATITFFGGIMVLFGRVEAANLNAFNCRTPAIPRSLKNDQSRLSQMFCIGGFYPDSEIEKSENMLMNFFENFFSRFILSYYGIVLVICLYIGYIAASIYGFSFFTLALTEKEMSDTNSYLQIYWNDYYKYFRKYPLRLQIIINEPLDYENTTIQEKIESIFLELENSESIASIELTESWLRQFLNFIKLIEYYLWYRDIDITRKDDFIFCLREVFLPLPGFQRFKDDIVFNENYTDIVASRYLVQVSEIKDPNHGVDLGAKVREYLDKQSINVFAYNFIMPLGDHVLMLKAMTIKSVIASILVMICVSVIFIPNVFSVSMMALTIISVELGLVGFMGLLSIHLNTITMVVLVIAVGFSIDTTAHIVCAFNESSGKTVEERLRKTLFYIGLPVTQGFLTSSIAAMFLALTKNEMKVSVAKLLLIVLSFSYFHGLFLLPVLICISYKIRQLFSKKEGPDILELKNSLKNGTSPQVE